MSSRTQLHLAAAMAFAFSVSACTESLPPAPASNVDLALSREQLPQPVIDQLLALRASLLEYESLDAAIADGFDTDLTGCMEMRPAGGMGHHYAKVGLLDGVPDATAPEALMYEPGPDGEMELVGVEFIVPFAAWSGDEPPVLFGRAMSYNSTFNVWALHAWLFKSNPRGVFADWNPRVGC